MTISHATREGVIRVLREFHGIVVKLDDTLPNSLINRVASAETDTIPAAKGGEITINLVEWHMSTATLDAMIQRRMLPNSKGKD